MDKWEYKVVEYTPYDIDLEQILNELGMKGWETMGVGGWGYSEGYKEKGFMIIMKRKLA